jgi:hypothetical protein
VLYEKKYVDDLLTCDNTHLLYCLNRVSLFAPKSPVRSDGRTNKAKSASILIPIRCFTLKLDVITSLRQKYMDHVAFVFLYYTRKLDFVHD